MKFIVVLKPAEEGGFNVSVPALDGCFTQSIYPSIFLYILSRFLP
ncbi:unnamed protein product [marine sediment metagenome]|uniref:HicB-like antitoxin of toxin-antitoxin system domain-containing protein n=1 Tax=marine sediment metagenome TaxID=412755 RepID=X1DJM2_9ZZZZ